MLLVQWVYEFIGLPHIILEQCQFLEKKVSQYIPYVGIQPKASFVDLL